MPQKRSVPSAVVTNALRACRLGLVAVGVFTGIINVLMLTGSFFMLQVYDRVIPSRSLPTLLGLFVFIIVLYTFQGVFDAIRGRLLVRIGASLDQHLSRSAYEAVVKLPLVQGAGPDGLQPVRDLDQVRSFLGGLGPTALFDLPWMPLYLGLCFLFHVWIGLTALVGAVLLIALTLLTDVMTRASAREVSQSASVRLGILEAGRRNAEVLRAMGMIGRVFTRWAIVNERYMDTQQRSSDVVGGLGALSRVLRMLLQSSVLAVGAWLVINQQATGGIIIASSILTSRALAPVELAIAHWRNFVAARQSWRRLTDLVSRLAVPEPSLLLPPPVKEIAVEALTVAPPGTQRFVVQNANFRLEAGDGLGIIGPSGSGKSSLVRALVGVWPAVRGKVRLDGAALDQWNAEQLGDHIGYLPQDVELFDGTIAENICRFEDRPESAYIIEAAKVASIHEMVLRLPDGYETRIGEGGSALSAGQRQRVALARAVYKSPFLLVLDEPNSNLDAEGDHALTQAIAATRGRGGIVMIVAHRPASLVGIDLLLVMANGQCQHFGSKDEIVKRLAEGTRDPSQRSTIRAEAVRAKG
ncbi:type I secretion system permease/ATPase [Rhodopseudomonas pseudopalustris]|uniref:type I secretion system permease/ATPase n=1 Tax=Rhodopseudomonas pseudopalustris TaxID=1513892 RepID=UPI003D31F1BE